MTKPTGLNPVQTAADLLTVIAGTELAAAEVKYNYTQTITGSFSQIVGLMLTVPATTTPVMLEYGAAIGVATAGGGTLQMDVRDIASIFTRLHYASAPVVPGMLTSYSGYGIPIAGRFRLPASATAKTYVATIGQFLDSGSGLVAVVRNAPDAPTYMRAVGL